MGIFSSLISPLLGQAKDLIGEFHLSPEDKLKADQVMAQLAEQAKQRADDHEAAMFKTQMEDRANARLRQMTIRDIMPGLLAIATFIGFTIVVVLLFTKTYPEGSKDILLLLLGAFVVCFKDVYGYYFGSSASSADKNEILTNLSQPQGGK